MTPERIAELRELTGIYDWSTDTDRRPDWAEMLNEIERLQGLVTSGHRLTDDDHCSCKVQYDGCPDCDWECWVWFDDQSTTTCPCAIAFHAAHVAEILAAQPGAPHPPPGVTP